MSGGAMTFASETMRTARELPGEFGIPDVLLNPDQIDVLDDGLGASEVDIIDVTTRNPGGVAQDPLDGGRRTPAGALGFILRPGNFHDEFLEEALTATAFPVATTAALVDIGATAPVVPSDFGGTFQDTLNNSSFAGVAVGEWIRFRNTPLFGGNDGVWLILVKPDDDNITVATSPDSGPVSGTPAGTMDMDSLQEIDNGALCQSRSVERVLDAAGVPEYQVYPGQGISGYEVTVGTDTAVEISYPIMGQAPDPDSPTSAWPLPVTTYPFTAADAASNRTNSDYGAIFTDAGEEKQFSFTSTDVPTGQYEELCVREFTATWGNGLDFNECQRSVDVSGLIPGGREGTIALSFVREASQPFKTEQYERRKPLFFHFVAPDNYKNGVPGATAYAFTYYRCRFDTLGDTAGGTELGAIVSQAGITFTGGGLKGSDVAVSIARFVNL